MTAWFVIGCGYVGTVLARRLVDRGVAVTITRRDGAKAAALAAELDADAVGPGDRAVGRDVSTAAILAAEAVAVIEGAAPAAAVLAQDASEPPAPIGIALDLADPALAVRAHSGAIVVCCAPPGPDPAAEMHRLAELARDAAKLIYVSSTGVYAAGGGARVDESWPLEPITASGRARLAAERALLAARPDAIVLRAAGIWGPGRGIADRLRAGTYRIVGDGSSHVSRIHVDDLVQAIERAAASDARGAINIADDDPAPIGELADALAAQLGVAAPPRVPAASVDPEVSGMLAADRRIANDRMKRELGVVLAHPSARPATK